MINARMQQFFFDRPEVRRRLRKKRLNALKRAGALSRKIIRNKPRRRKRRSNPGETPTVHTKGTYATLRNVQFAYDPAADSVVVGPVKIGSANAEPGEQVAPETLEYGGNSYRNPLWRKMEVGGSGPIELDKKRLASTRKWGVDRGEQTINRGKRGGKSAQDVNDYQGTRRTVVFAHLETPMQAAKAQRIHDQVWGPKHTKAKVAPRPFVAPAMRDAAPKYPEIYAKESSR
jgi:hypothetical protein